LFCGFAGTVNDLRKAAAELTVVVYAGEAEVLKRQMPKLSNRLVDANITVFDLF
jgi:hypothetical protein